MKQITLLAALTIMIVTACSKDPKPPACETNSTSVAGAYKITAVKYKSSASASEVDYMNVLFPDACDRDNIYTFNANGTYIIKDAGTVCSPNGDDNGTWSLSGSTMVIDGDPTALEKFDCKDLVIMNSGIMVLGDQLRLTLTKQ